MKKNIPDDVYYQGIIKSIRRKEEELKAIQSLKKNKRFKSSPLIDEQIENKKNEIKELQALIWARQ